MVVLNRLFWGKNLSRRGREWVGLGKAKKEKCNIKEARSVLKFWHVRKTQKVFRQHPASLIDIKVFFFIILFSIVRPPVIWSCNCVTGLFDMLCLFKVLFHSRINIFTFKVSTYEFIYTLIVNIVVSKWQTILVFHYDEWCFNCFPEAKLCWWKIAGTTTYIYVLYTYGNYT